MIFSLNYKIHKYICEIIEQYRTSVKVLLTLKNCD